MERKAQGAIEYLMTYGWAILVVIIVGIILWQSGVFNLSNEGASGFRQIKVEDFKWSSTGGWSMIVQNTVGQTMKHLNVTYSGDMADAEGAQDGTITRGKTYTDTNTSNTCTADEPYEIDVTVSYTSGTGLTKSDTGVIRGTCQ